MSYQKTVWINDETPLNQQNMNKIEDALLELFSSLGLNSTSIGDLTILLNETIARVIIEEEKSDSFAERLDILDLEGGRVFQIEIKNVEQDNRLDALDDSETGHIQRLDTRIDLNVSELERIDLAKTEQEFSDALEVRVTDLENNKIDKTDRGIPGGIAPLNTDGVVPLSYLPGRVAPLESYETYGDLPSLGVVEKIYKIRDTNLIYRWDGHDYVEISKSLALGETSATAFPGDLGRIAYDRAFDTYTIEEIDEKVGTIDEVLSILLDE